jgi:ATP-dependent helicase/nuclease subunit A
LPQFEEEKRAVAAEEYVKKQGRNLSANEQKKAIDEVLSLINNPKFALLFASNSKAEVPVMGEVDGRIISGQIDRLAITDDKVMIVDYKTNRPAAKNIEDVPGAYIKQLKIYKRLVEKIYNNRKIETYILWTNTSEIMLIE